jgi:energy-coupling factor transport system permease protein
VSIVVKYIQLVDYLTKYTPTGGFLYRLNPVTKLVIFGANLILGIYLSSPGFSFLAMLFVFMATSIFMAAGGFPFRETIRQQWPLLVLFFSVIFLANTFFGKTQFNPNIKPVIISQLVVFGKPWITLSYQGLNDGISVTLFYASVFIAAVALVRTTRVSDLSYSLQRLGLPFSVALILTITIRSVSLVSGKLVTTYNAQRSRGFELEKGWGLKTIRNITTIFRPLVSQLLRTAYDMGTIFQARGLDFSSKKRTRLRPTTYGVADYGIIVVCLAVSAILVAAVPPSFYG